MPVFVWEGRTRGGDLKRGELEAATAADVERRLEAQGLTPSRIKKKAAEIHLKMPGSSGVTMKELVVFTRQLATMIDAGLPIVQALDLLAAQEPNVHFKAVLKDIKLSVETGSTFAEALKKHPKVFDELYVNLVAAGELGGVLDTILNRLAIHIEKAVKLRRRVKSAMTYPSVVFCVAILVVGILLYKVIPTFQEMFQNFGNAELPAPTQFVIDISEFFIAKFWLFVLGIGGLVFGFGYAMRQRPFRRRFDKFILRVPVFGPVLRKAAVARFTRTLGTMISSGVPILDALDIVGKSSGNIAIEEAVAYVREKISAGSSMCDPLLETRVFPDMVVQMLAVGEATGAMDQMLNKIADFYEDEVDVAVEGLTQLMEPIMMVFIGGVVGGILIAMYLPIFSLADTVKDAGH